MSEERSTYNAGQAPEVGDYTDAELDAIDRWAAFGRSADCVTIGRLIGQIRRERAYIDTANAQIERLLALAHRYEAELATMRGRSLTTAEIKGGLTEGAMDGDMFADPGCDALVDPDQDSWEPGPFRMGDVSYRYRPD